MIRYMLSDVLNQDVSGKLNSEFEFDTWTGGYFRCPGGTRAVSLRVATFKMQRKSSMFP